jgi:cold shock CspA family protein
VNFFKSDKGYGFIKTHDGSPEVFFYFSAVSDGLKLQVSDVVAFDAVLGKNGGPAASNVRLVDGRLRALRGDILTTAALLAVVGIVLWFIP